MSRSQLLLLELNEVNFDFVMQYCSKGLLKTFATLEARHGLSKTVSESNYEELEPWIQWVTAHTGLTLAEHGVFRLGDIVNRDIPQIWEQLEDRGISVGAISPMNAKNRLRAPAFFIPDPWTPAEATTTPLLRRFLASVSQVVNDNAQSRFKPSSAAWLAVAAARYARVENYGTYIHLVAHSRSRPWYRAMFLDLLLSDIFIGSVQNTKPRFASLFLNAAAHIQHHYLFSSACYAGPRRNPSWYLRAGKDPVLDVYALYDRIVRQIETAFPGAHLMLATGLHQVPHEAVTFYWRLKNHARYLREIGVHFLRVEPRMSRDFVVFCNSVDEASLAEERLNAVVSSEGIRLFEVDNRGTDLFVMLTYPREVTADTRYIAYDGVERELLSKVAFVALKNGEHNGVGYFLDTTTSKANSIRASQFPLKELPGRIAAFFENSDKQVDSALKAR